MNQIPRTTKLYGRILVIDDTKQFLQNFKDQVTEEHPEEFSEIMISIDGHEVTMPLETFIERIFTKG